MVILNVQIAERFLNRHLNNTLWVFTRLQSGDLNAQIVKKLVCVNEDFQKTQ